VLQDKQAKRRKCEVADKVSECDEDQPASENVQEKPAKNEDSSSDTKTKAISSTESSAAEISGYMPRREEVIMSSKCTSSHLRTCYPQKFAVEWDDDAELILADMEFKDSDDDDREQKLKILSIYNQKLDERVKRKRFVLERNLYDFKRIRAREKNLSKEEYQLLKTMRPFARFQSAEQHDKMVAGMIEELRLRRRIEQLKSYEQMGVEVLPHEAFEQRPNVETCGQSEREKRWLKRDREVLQRGSSESAQNLTDEERKVCSVLHLLPQHYDVMKHMLVHKAAHAGCLKQGVANQPLKIDIHKNGQTYDLFVKSASSSVQ